MDKSSHAGQTAGSSSRAPSRDEPTSGKTASASPSIAPDGTETIERFASSTSNAAASLAADAKDAAQSAGRAVREQTAQLAENVGQELKKTAEDQKLRGADAIQCFAPEDELMGETSDSVKAALDEAASEQLETAKDAAGAVVQDAKAAAEREGLTPDAAAQAVRSLGEKVKSIVSDAASTGSSEMAASGRRSSPSGPVGSPPADRGPGY